MGAHTQHIPVTAPTCASPAGEWHCHILGGDQELAASAGPQVPGAHTHPGDSTENSAATAAPMGFTEWDLPAGIYLGKLLGCWCSRIFHTGFTMEQKQRLYFQKAKSEGTTAHPNPGADGAGIWPGWKARGRRQKAAAGKTSHLYNRT